MENEIQLNSQNKFKININGLKNPVQVNSGLFGSVYLVQDKKTEEYYEAKVLSHGNSNSKYKQSIIREISIIIRVQHPTLIKFRGYSLTDFEGNDNITILMDYPSNGSLAGAIKNKQNLISNNKYDNTARQIILVGISRGMMHLHKYHIIHPCLTLDNILLDKDLKPLITNFCLSKFFEKTDSKDRHTNIESLVYKAPEVILTNKYNHRSDVYSFGILMYEIITESIPFPSFQEDNKMSIEQFKEKVVKHNYRPEFKVPIKKSIRHLIERCWSKNTKERPTFEEIFNKLAFNIEDSIYDIFDSNDDEQDPNKYQLDDVDADRLQSYINEIDENNANNISFQSEIKKLKKKLEVVTKENKQLKEQLSNQKNIKGDEIKNNSQKDALIKKKLNKYENQISIDDFNLLPLKSQQLIIERIIQFSSDEELTQNLTNLNNLLIFLSQFDISSDSIGYIQISSKDPSENSLKLIENPRNLKQIYILSNATEILFINKTLESFNFRSILSKFEEVLIEIKYPSKSFKEIFDISLNLKSTTRSKIKIGLFIFEISSSDDFYKIKLDINSIRIDPCITFFSESSFSEFSSLTKITIPSSVILIEGSAFEKCKSLQQIDIPSSVKKIGKRCFCGCRSLKQITLPISVKSIGMSAFKDCTSLTEVTILSPLKLIEDSLFLRCSSLIKIKIPKTVESIGRKSFGDCKMLKEIEIPDSVTSIGKIAFEGCSSLSDIKIAPSSSKMATIGEGAFQSCSSLSEIILPLSLIEIGWNVFSGCSNLKTISIPSSVEEVKYNVFSGCLKLQSIKIDPYKTKYSTQTFDDLSSLFHLEFLPSVTTIHYVYKIFEKFTKISIPDSVLSIGKNSFSSCKNLIEISIPSSVTSIGDSAFFGCSKLTKMSIPSSVTSIGSSAFSGCSSLTRVSIPASVALIGNNAFFGCSSLKMISILSNFTSIGESAFQGCSSLTQIKICTSVDSIGSGAFSGCSSLMQIQVPYSMNSILKSNKYEMLGIDKRVKIVTI